MASGIFKALSAVLSGLFAITKWMAIAAAIGAVAQAVVVLAGALVQLAGLTPLILPGILALASAFGALKIAFSGFGEALKAGWAGDAEKFTEAMKKLAPAMQDTVKSIIKLKPALDGLKKSVQQAFFANLANDISVLAGVYLPLLQKHLTGVAEVFNRLTRDVIKLFLTKDFVADWASTLGHVRGILANVMAAIVPVIDGFRQIGTVAAPILERLTSGFLDGAQAFAARMAELRANGGLEDFINKGLNAAGELIKILVALGSAIMPLFRILSSPEALAGITAITQQFAVLMNSAQGMAFIRSIFEILNSILKSLGPGVIAVLGALGKSLLILAPAFTALGDAVSSGLVLLGPVLEEAAGFIRDIVIGLTPVLPIVADAIGSIVRVLGPALIKLAPVVVDLFEALGRVVGPVADILADLIVGLAPSLVVVVDALAQGLIALIPAATPVAEAIGAILEVIAPLLPVIAQLAGILLTALATELGAIAMFLIPLVKGFAQLATTVMDRLMPVFTQLVIDAGPKLALLFEAFLINLTPLLPLLLELANIFAEKLVYYLPQITAMWTEMAPIFQQVAYLLGVYLLQGLQALMPYLPDLIDLAMQLMMAFLQFAPILLPLIPQFLELALMLQRLLIDSGALKGIILLLELGIAAMIVGVRIAVGILQGWAATISFLIGVFKWFGNTVWEVFQTVRRLFSDLGGTIKSAIGNLGDILYGAGQSVIQGLWNGIKSMGSWFAGNVRNFINNYIPGPVKSFLGISSPSKVMAKLGRWIPAGLAVGMDAGKGMVTDAATRLAIAAMPALQVAAPGVPSVGGYGAGTSDRKRGGDQYFLVDLGDGVRKAVKAVLVDDPALVAASTDEGRRQRSFSSSPRAKV